MNLKPLAILLAFLPLAVPCHATSSIDLTLPRTGCVSLNLYRPDGSLLTRLLAGSPMSAGHHRIPLPATPLASGTYTWRAFTHGPLALRVRGWIGDFGGDRGVPSAAVTDGAGIYLGWSLASAAGASVVACDPAGHILWTHHRGALSGCHALAADAGLIYVLGGEGADAAGRALYRLNAATGAIVPWPNGRTDLKIVSLWPPNGNYKPDHADYLAVSNGRVYLSFTAGQFVALLDAKTGAYVQTIVGTQLGAISSVPTKSNTPDNPDGLVNADFLVIGVNTPAIAKMLLAHDPVWVLADELTPLDQADQISALAMIGDGAKHHARDIFVAYAPPVNRIEARPALDTDNVIWQAGHSPSQAWRPDALQDIRALALDSTGQLWVAEGADLPRRFTVWSTAGTAGHLLRQYFAPPDPTAPVAVDPLDPAIVFAEGCEWRIDPATGQASCIDIITHDPLKSASFVTQGDYPTLLVSSTDGNEAALDRLGPGNYAPHPRGIPKPAPAKLLLSSAWHLTTADDFDLGPLLTVAPDSHPDHPALNTTLHSLSPGTATPAITQTPAGKTYLAAATPARTLLLELTGLDTLKPLATGTVSR